MVSQGAQTNGINGKVLTKSYSEMGGTTSECTLPHDDVKK